MTRNSLIIIGVILAVAGVGGVLGAGVMDAGSRAVLPSLFSPITSQDDPRALEYMSFVKNIEGRRIQSISGNTAVLDSGETIDFASNSGCQVGDIIDSYRDQSESLFCRDRYNSVRRSSYFFIPRRSSSLITNYLLARNYLNNNGYQYDPINRSYLHSSGRNYIVENQENQPAKVTKKQNAGSGDGDSPNGRGGVNGKKSSGSS